MAVRNIEPPFSKSAAIIASSFSSIGLNRKIGGMQRKENERTHFDFPNREQEVVSL
mgnify:CR=1 FL=1